MKLGTILNQLFGVALIKNLKSSTARKDHISSECKQIDLSFEIFEAVNGKLHVGSDFTLIHGPYLLSYPSSAGYIGNQMTSHKIITHAIESSYSSIMMLDDDCIFSHTSGCSESVIKDIEEQLPKDWDIIILGDIYGDPVTNQRISYRKCVEHHEATGSHGVAINSKVFSELQYLFSNTSFLGDGAIGRLIDINKNVYKLMPSICMQDRKILSDINEIIHTW
jgi:GR25 family glycosyltransferase involved in LPS biosynthesis